MCKEPKSELTAASLVEQGHQQHRDSWELHLCSAAAWKQKWAAVITSPFYTRSWWTNPTSAPPRREACQFLHVEASPFWYFNFNISQSWTLQEDTFMCFRSASAATGLTYECQRNLWPFFVKRRTCGGALMLQKKYIDLRWLIMRFNIKLFDPLR